MNAATIRNGLGNIKKVHILLILGFAFSVIISPLVTNNVFAATLTQTMVRFDRMKISTGTTGTVCARPATVGTETTVKVTFPTGYTLGAAGTFTVNTTNTGWPTATAWPSIATATTVAGQDVTFPSGDLTVGTLYCFNWTNTAAVTTKSSATSSNLGVVTTQASGPTTIDSGEFATATIADDQIVVSAAVPQVFSFALSGNTDALGTLGTGTVSTSPTPRVVTVGTNAKNGWQVWAKSAYQGLCSVSVSGTCTSGTPTASPNIPTTNVGNIRTLTAGTTDYNTSVVASPGTGTGNITVASDFNTSTAYRGGGLSTAFQSLATSSGTNDGATLTIKNNVAISAIVAAATDYSDTITIVGAGLF